MNLGIATVTRWLSGDHLVGQALLTARMRAQLALWRPATEERVLKAAIARIAPAYTMVDLTRLRRLVDLAATVARERIDGAIVECGTWRGGGLALMDWAMRQSGSTRLLWGFDSFEGLPPPGDRDEERVHRQFFTGWCTAAPDDVRAAVTALGGDVSRLRLVRGWLCNTLARSDTGPIALLNVDVDWYDSVRTTLVALYDHVTPGGIINFDDYGRWRGCGASVHDFLRERGLPETIVQTSGRYGAWVRKP